MKVLHIITGLNDGGAEATLFRLCKADKLNEHHVISLMDHGRYGLELELDGVFIETLNMPVGKVTLSGIFKLFKLIRLKKPDAVQTWMYHADFLGGIVSRLAGIKNVNWGVHHSDLIPEHSKKSTIIIARLCSLLSYFIPKSIICCAEKSAEVHKNIGYSSQKLKVVNNGYDLNYFKVDEISERQIKEELNISDNTVLLGKVSRFHPYKDHERLIKALGLLKKDNVDFKCLLVGTGLSYDNAHLERFLIENDVLDSVILLGPRKDVPRIMNAIDIHILSSSSEAFPNVLNEAMACGTPCVTTDVGDAAMIVGDTGWVVTGRKPDDLTFSIKKSINEMAASSESWEKKKIAARSRIVDNYSIEVMVNKYNEVWFGGK